MHVWYGYLNKRNLIYSSEMYQKSQQVCAMWEKSDDIPDGCRNAELQQVVMKMCKIV